ncbi:chlorophyllase-like protein [Fontibacillus phaseoli]|uniref:Chlorophyllase-like protein n=1 Tax=Fontibacillus phaseoli TaxID=1416533 RepID=A0A369BJ78_9BACL|nr:alpha/beta hydrolase [Fontibacillus phaseoli]RCX20487.1 chlorophyllase-like protein [Fontibacillus phaseoli]
MELEFQTEYVAVKQPKIPLRSKLRKRIRRTYRYDTAFWRIAMAGPWGAGIFAFTLAALGMPTGLGAAFDIMTFAFAGTIALFLGAHLVALLLSLTGLPVPRLYLGSVLFDLAAIFLIFFQEDEAFAISAIVSTVVTMAGILIGLLLGLLASRKIPLRFKACLAGVLVLVCLSAAVWPDKAEPAISADLMDFPAISASNPAEPGSYGVKSFYYGSGRDFWQSEYGQETDLISDTVDASAYIKKWSRFRTFYWGFNEQALPLNGRVWMPEREGQFPLVLIVHGNHLMEDYSDDGYAYLGKLLASRGFIAVSVDENFLNYSVWTGIPDNDMKVRAWMLLKHLQQIGSFAENPDTPFYDAVDFGQIGLIGHSRGGQAVSMAFDYKRWFAADSTLKNMDNYQIRAIAAIAPTDKKVDDSYAKLQDVSYLTLQGARDGDVNDFDGERQYARTSFSAGDPSFKASLYIADANHSQFNTGWGGRDVSYPKGILLSRKGLLPAAEQRSIAKVYISAFLESTLHRQEQYLPLFRDYRSGLSWLPETAYFNRFESGKMTSWAKFDEDMKRMTLPGGGVAEGQDLVWKEEEAKNRRKSGKGTRGAVLERNGDVDDISTYSLNWKKAAPSPEPGPALLSFSLSDRSYEMKTDGKEADGEQVEAAAVQELDIEVELESLDGITVRLPLSDFMPIFPLPETSYTLHPWLDLHLSDGKYKNPTEAVFQTYQLPLSAFTEEDARFHPASGIRKLTFRLTGGSGRVMLDDIGVY